LNPYVPVFKKGATVRIADRSELGSSGRCGAYHHPLDVDQLRFAGTLATVQDVGIYHGGDQLYQLSGVPGIWHLQCLKSVQRASRSWIS
jgi:hypothetical protein